MARKEHERFALPERLGRKMQQHHGISGEQHVEPWRPAGSRSAHSSGTLHSLYYAPLTAAHPVPGSSRQSRNMALHACSISSDLSGSFDKENVFRGSRIFKPKKAGCCTVLTNQAHPTSRTRIRCGRSSSEARAALQPVNVGQFATVIKGKHVRIPAPSSENYSTIMTSTFTVSGRMLVNSSGGNKASGISKASAPLPASCNISTADASGSGYHQSQACSPTSGAQKPMLFGMQAGGVQRHTSPAALRYTFNEPGNNIRDSSNDNHSHSARCCSSGHTPGSQDTLQKCKALEHLQQEQQRPSLWGQGGFNCCVPEQLQEVAKLANTSQRAATFLEGPRSAFAMNQPRVRPAVDGGSHPQHQQEGQASRPQPDSPLQHPQQQTSRQRHVNLDGFGTLAARPVQHEGSGQGMPAQLQQLGQHPPASTGSTSSQPHAGPSDCCSAATPAAQHVRLFLDQHAEAFEPCQSQQPQWQQERRLQPQQLSATVGIDCASSSVVAVHSVSYQQLLKTCASMVHNSNAAYMHMRRYQWQRSNAPLGTPGTSTRTLSRMHAQQCSRPQVSSSTPATPSLVKLVNALRMSSPAVSRTSDSPACTPGLHAGPQFNGQSMLTQPSGSHRSSSSSTASLPGAAEPASPALSVYLTPAPAGEAGRMTRSVHLLSNSSAAAVVCAARQHVSKAVQTSPPHHCGSSSNVPEVSPWWHGLQQAQQKVCRDSPGAQVQPRVLFGAASPAPSLPAVELGEGASPAHFPFRCRSNNTEEAAAARSRQSDEHVSPGSISLESDGAESGGDAQPESKPKPAARMVATGSTCTHMVEHGEEWSVHNNALVWPLEGDATTVGIRSIEDVLQQPATAINDKTNRQPLQPIVFQLQQSQQQQQQPSPLSSFAMGGAMRRGENISPVDALAHLTQVAHKLKTRIDDSAASSVAPMLSKADLGLVVLASPLSGCGRWQQGGNSSSQHA